jgi:hypothetical protein
MSDLTSRQENAFDVLVIQMIRTERQETHSH